MKIIRHEVPLGGGEGSRIYYYFTIGKLLAIPLAKSSFIKFSNPKRSWVSELNFLDDFSTTEDLEEILNDCEDDRLIEYFENQIAEFSKEKK